ncbi:hypothetical protein ABZX95_38955 [Streptomyces sp. NPDC004232]|uniref:hypothetical protein n=1 Tax=Streptomyces sp. NPDC004232 TaxID=3154454 RepID=UPI001D97B641|nr:hypothetical protein [Streptomyces sp. tea 10]
MPVKYIDVRASSELFAPEVRAFGDIAIVGKGGFGSPASDAEEFTSPGAATQYLKALGGTTLSADAAKGANSVTASASVPAPVLVRFTADKVTEVHTVTAVAPVLPPAPPPAPPPTPATGPPVAPPAPAAPAAFTLTLDAPLSAAYPTGSKVTQESDSDLLRAVRTAFAQTPPPTVVWGVPVDYASPQWDDGLTKVDKLDVQIVLLANTPLNATTSGTLTVLKQHVTADLGDGKERIGVAMLDPAVKQSDLKSLVSPTVIDERMVLIAHKSNDDAAAALAGVIAGYEPHISLLLKPISIAMTDVFSDTEIDGFNDVLVNWVTRPVLLPGQALYLGEGYTSDASHDKKYVDIVRTLDDINFRIKAALIEVIGNLRISRVGLRAVETIVQSVLAPLVSRQVIADFSIVIPLLTLLDKDPADLSAAEAQEISDARAGRLVDMTVQVVYAGAIHRLKIDLVLKG